MINVCAAEKPYIIISIFQNAAYSLKIKLSNDGEIESIIAPLYQMIL